MVKNIVSLILNDILNFPMIQKNKNNIEAQMVLHWYYVMLRTLNFKVLADTRHNKLLPPHHFYAKLSYFSRHFMQTVKVKMPENNKHTNFNNILHLYK